MLQEHVAQVGSGGQLGALVGGGHSLHKVVDDGLREGEEWGGREGVGGGKDPSIIQKQSARRKERGLGEE